MIAFSCTPTICPPSYFGRMRAWEKRAAGLCARFWTSSRVTEKRFSADAARGSRAAAGRGGGRAAAVRLAGRGPSVALERELLAAPAVPEHDPAALDAEHLGLALELIGRPARPGAGALEVLDRRPGERGVRAAAAVPRSRSGSLVFSSSSSTRPAARPGASVETLKRFRSRMTWRCRPRSRGGGRRSRCARASARAGGSQQRVEDVADDLRHRKMQSTPRAALAVRMGTRFIGRYAWETVWRGVDGSGPALRSAAVPETGPSIAAERRGSTCIVRIQGVSDRAHVSSAARARDGNPSAAIRSRRAPELRESP